MSERGLGAGRQEAAGERESLCADSPRWPQIKLVKWGWYADVPVPFTRIWLICDAGRNWEIGWRRP